MRLREWFSREHMLYAAMIGFAFGVSSHLVCNDAQAQVSTTYVRRSGDSMSGTLSVPSLRIPTNGKICLDGATCAKYIFYDGVNTNLSSGNFILAASGGFITSAGNISNLNGGISTSSGQQMDIGSSIADGSTAKAIKMHSTTTYSTSGAKLLSVLNNTTEKFSVDKDGAGVFASTITGGSLISSGGSVFSDYLQSQTSTPSTTLELRGQASDNASFVGVAIGASVAIANATAKLVSIRTTMAGTAVEKGYWDKDGNAYFATANPVPSVHSTNVATPQVMERGTQALTTGSANPAFGTAFNAAPICVCTDQTANASVKCNASITNLAITGTGSDTIAYICMGNK